MSIVQIAAWRVSRIAKFVLRRLLQPCLLLLLAYGFQKMAIFYVMCGLYDVSRNDTVSGTILRRYFLGNGVLTWGLSPINITLDLLSLPYRNKGVYRLEDLPDAHREEVTRLIEAAKNADLVRQLDERAKKNQRTMIFFRWYGVNIDTFLDVPAFHQPWKYIQTIGVSTFTRRVSTSKHFGFMRATFRVLYNLDAVIDESAYIVVGNTINLWRDSRLFIFDDTLLHESINESDQVRHCLFVDILRPTPFPALMRAVVYLIGLLPAGFRAAYYQNWKVIH